MERFAILIWIQVRHIKKELSLHWVQSQLLGFFRAFHFPACPSLTEIFFSLMAAFPIQLIVKIVEVQNKLCLIFVYNN